MASSWWFNIPCLWKIIWGYHSWPPAFHGEVHYFALTSLTSWMRSVPLETSMPRVNALTFAIGCSCWFLRFSCRFIVADSAVLVAHSCCDRCNISLYHNIYLLLIFLAFSWPNYRQTCRCRHLDRNSHEGCKQVKNSCNVKLWHFVVDTQVMPTVVSLLQLNVAASIVMPRPKCHPSKFSSCRLKQNAECLGWLCNRQPFRMQDRCNSTSCSCLVLWRTMWAGPAHT